MKNILCVYNNVLVQRCTALCTSKNLKKWEVREPVRNRLVFDSTPRKNANIPYMVELERPVNLAPGVPDEIRVFVDNTIGEGYVDNKTAMSTRKYNFKKGK